MGQRLRVVGWLRFSNKNKLARGLQGFAARAAPGHYDEGSWETEGLDARVVIDTELPGDFENVEWPFMAMIREASCGYIDYFEAGNDRIMRGRGKGGPLKRWALAHLGGKQARLTMSVGTMSLGYPAEGPDTDTTAIIEGAYEFATARAAATAVATLRLLFLTAGGLRELRLGPALAVAGTRVQVKATILGPWEQLHEPLVEILSGLSLKATSGKVSLRGDRLRYEIASKARVTSALANEHVSPWPDAPTLRPVDPAAADDAAAPGAAAPGAAVVPGDEAAGKRGGKKGPRLLDGEGGPVLGARVLGDGGLLTWGGARVTLWSLPSLEVLRTVDLSTPGETAWPILGVFELPGGRLLVTHEMDGDLDLIDKNSGERRRLKGHGNTVSGAVVAGELLLTWSTDHTLRRWSLAGDDGGLVLRDPDSSLRRVIPLGDGTVLVTNDGPTYRLRPATGEVVERLGRVTAYHPLSGGRYLLEEYGKFRLYGGAPLSFTLEEGHDHRVFELAPDRVAITNLPTFHEVSLVDGAARPVRTGHSKDVRDLTWLGGDLWVSHGRSMPGLNERFGFDGRLKSWSSQGWVELASCDVRAPIAGAVALRGGRAALRLDDALHGKEVPVIEARTGRLLTTIKGPKKAVLGLIELPDGRLLLWSKDGVGRAVSLDGAA